MVAFTENVYLISISLLIGTLAMRFVTQGFVGLMEKFTFLETVIFWVVGVLGIKQILSFAADVYQESVFIESSTDIRQTGFFNFNWTVFPCLLMTFPVFLIIPKALLDQQANLRNLFQKF